MLTTRYAKGTSANGSTNTHATHILRHAGVTWWIGWRRGNTCSIWSCWVSCRWCRSVCLSVVVIRSSACTLITTCYIRIASGRIRLCVCVMRGHSVLPLFFSSEGSEWYKSQFLRKARTVSRAFTLLPMAACIGTGNIWRGIVSRSFLLNALPRS